MYELQIKHDRPRWSSSVVIRKVLVAIVDDLEVDQTPNID